MNGSCKLCLRQSVELRKSHFLPAAAFRILRDERLDNPNPYVITNRTLVQTSRQMTAPLLCHECEQRLEKNGENWVFKNCVQKDGSFPLDAILNLRPPDVESSTTKVYYAANIPEIDIAALVYFSASVFWRGSIHTWNDDRSIPVRLGPFQESFRAYLMGLAGFPRDCALSIALQHGPGKYQLLAYPPYGERKGNFHVYKFPMSGVGFSLIVSKNLPSHFRTGCLVHGPGNPIVKTTFLDAWLEQDAVKKIQSNPRILEAFRNRN